LRILGPLEKRGMWGSDLRTGIAGKRNPFGPRVQIKRKISVTEK